MTSRARSGDDGRLASRSFHRILLIKPSSLGDVVHALPVLHGLRERYPAARIEWLIGSAFAPLLDGHPAIDELVLFDRKRFGRIGRDGGATGDFVRFLRDLRARRYDLVIDLQGLFRTGFLSWASRAPVRIGLGDAREGAWVFYTHRVRSPDPDIHAVDRNYLVGGLLGFADKPIQFPLPLDAGVRASAARMLREAGLAEGTTVVAIVPGARWETKVWLADRFANTIDALEAGGNHSCVLLGGADESALCSRIAALCRSKPVNLAGRTSLRELVALLERMDVVLCHDSAPLHLAAALGRPLVCLVGPTNPRRTGPYRRMDDVLSVSLECSPCYLRRLSECGYEHRCMRDLTTEAVVDAVRRRVRPLATACCVTTG